jgi:gliding motility-associated-like protein
MYKFLLTLISILILTVTSHSQCLNTDFELGNFTGWFGKRGFCCPVALPNNGIINSRQTIVSQGLDPNTCGGLQTVFDGNFSARLGNDNIGAEAEGLYYTLTVTPQNTLIRYAYAVVFEDPGHTDEEQPRFSSRVRLSNGQIIQCTDYTVTAASNLPNFQYCPSIGSDGSPLNIAWRNWSVVSVDLSSYIGQTVTIEFETGDCSLGGHFGYAYIDFLDCSSTQIDIQYCINDTSAVLIAPPGFSNYLWSTGDTAQIITVNPNLYTSISCVITTSSGCIVNLSTNLQPSIPIPDFNWNDDCLPQKNFTNLSIITGTDTIQSFLWNFGDGNTSSDFSPSHFYNSPGTYIVTLSVTSNDGCNSQISKQIKIWPQISADFVTNDVCLSGISLFTNLTTQYTGYQNNYFWNFGDSQTSNQQSPTHIYQNFGVYNVSLISEINGSSCRDTVNKTVIVYQNPIVNILSEDNCVGEVSSFYNFSQVPSWSTNNTYLWNFGQNGWQSTQQNPTFTYPSWGEYTVSLNVTSQNGSISCSSQNSITVQIYPIPQVNFESNNTFCFGEEVQFYNDSYIQSGLIINYIWNFGDNNFSNQVNPTHTYTSAGTYQVVLTAISNSGCQNQSSTLINIYPNPIADIQNGPFSGCEDLRVQFQDNSIGNVTNWNWFFGDGYSSNSPNPVHTYTNPGQYLVKLNVVNGNGCQSIFSDSTTVTVYPTPVSNFIIENSQLDEYNNNVNLINLSQGANFYLWNFGDGQSSIEYNTDHTYSDYGEYNISLVCRNQYGCSDTSYKRIDIKPVFTFYIPNAFTPSEDGRNEIFFGKGTNYTSVTMQIFNRWGQKIYEETSQNPVWNGKLNGQDCQIDVYVYQFFVTDIFGIVHVYSGRIALVR